MDKINKYNLMKYNSIHVNLPKNRLKVLQILKMVYMDMIKVLIHMKINKGTILWISSLSYYCYRIKLL